MPKTRYHNWNRVRVIWEALWGLYDTDVASWAKKSESAEDTEPSDVIFFDYMLACREFAEILEEMLHQKTLEGQSNFQINRTFERLSEWRE